MGFLTLTDEVIWKIEYKMKPAKMTFSSPDLAGRNLNIFNSDWKLFERVFDRQNWFNPRSRMDVV